MYSAKVGNTRYSMYNFDKLIKGEINAQEDGHISYANEPYKADNFTYTHAEIGSDTSFSHIIKKLETMEAKHIVEATMDINRDGQESPMTGVDVAIGKADFGDNSLGQITKPKQENNKR